MTHILERRVKALEDLTGTGATTLSVAAATITTLTAPTIAGAVTHSGVVTFQGMNVLKNSGAVTAFATGGQASATALTSTINNVSVCATAGDSVKLPAALAGQQCLVMNTGAAYVNIFPVTGETIDALGANASISLNTGGSILFSCSVAGAWKALSQGKPDAKFTTGTTTTTFAAGQLTGAGFVNYTNTQATPGSIATRTAAQMFQDDPYARVGGSYILRVTNGQGTGTLTITAGSNVTLTGTMTVAINTTRDFVVTYTTAAALVIQNIGTGSFS